MCFCHEFNKRFSSKDLYHGRPIQSATVKYTKLVSPQVSTKIRPLTTKYSKKSKGQR